MRPIRWTIILALIAGCGGLAETAAPPTTAAVTLPDLFVADDR